MAYENNNQQDFSKGMSQSTPHSGSSLYGTPENDSSDQNKYPISVQYRGRMRYFDNDDIRDLVTLLTHAINHDENIAIQTHYR